ncbi:RNA recognition motif domain containing protein [Entamoeba histolytica]|uniref:RNA recognition motif domain containing protein n=2 Tax=Entamoeba histolytica TaxID=5759 RepID=A0A175JMN2_ENTHI|nr:RNA recognition motif domain containing protein [Entamoeba histolytica HM-1:IMSS-A]GAT94897.1 RNA recognition motif domain containing protein [Entamoeba histolytica]
MSFKKHNKTKKINEEIKKKEEDNNKKDIETKPKKERPQVGVSDKKLFVIGLPKDYSNEEFQTLMGEVAPVKKAFIITTHGSKECTGNGYAIYGTIEDARLAKRKLNRKKIKKGKEIKTIYVKFADKKLRDEKETAILTKRKEEKPFEDSFSKQTNEEKKELEIKQVEKESSQTSSERTKRILENVLDEIDNGQLNQQSDDDEELKMTRTEREAKKKLAKGQLKRKQQLSKLNEECDGHIRFESYNEKKPKQFKKHQKQSKRYTK